MDAAFAGGAAAPGGADIGRKMRFAEAARVAARVAAIELGWQPAVFWAATPEELRVALGLDVGSEAAPLDEAWLRRLMEAFPDGC